MNKYVITNCPALTDQGECYQGSVFMGTAFKECQERTDCVLKRIVERCSLYEFNYPVNQAIQMLTQNIKDMLEIEEIND